MSKFDAFREDRQLFGHDEEYHPISEDDRLQKMIELERACEDQGWLRAAALARKEIDRLLRTKPSSTVGA